MIEHQESCIIERTPFTPTSKINKKFTSVEQQDKGWLVSAKSRDHLAQFTLPIQNLFPEIHFKIKATDPKTLISIGIKIKDEQAIKTNLESDAGNSKLVMDQVDCYAVCLIPFGNFILSKVDQKYFEHKNVKKPLMDLGKGVSLVVRITEVSVIFMMGKYAVLTEIDHMLSCKMGEAKVVFLSVRSDDCDVEMELRRSKKGRRKDKI